jgi:hypothetical protein
VNRDAGLETLGGPVGAQRVRVREPLGHAGGRAAAPHEPVYTDGGEGEGLLVTVAAEADDSGCSSSSPTPRARGWTAVHASSACCTARMSRSAWNFG